MDNFKGNPNRLLSESLKSLRELGDKLKNFDPDSIVKGMEQDKKYNFTFKGKKGIMLTFKSKVISLEIEGVNDEEIREILDRLNDRPA